jgi:hypothetical protein
MLLYVGEPVQQPVFVIIKQCLPVFGKICANYAGDAEVTDAVCAVLKQGVTTLQAGGLITPYPAAPVDRYYEKVSDRILSAGGWG